MSSIERENFKRLAATWENYRAPEPRAVGDEQTASLRHAMRIMRRCPPTVDPERVARYEQAAERVTDLVPGHLGECVALVILDRAKEQFVDPNIGELVKTVLADD